MAVPPGVVTSTSTVPAAWDGVSISILVELTSTRPLPAEPPNSTALTLVRLVPSIVTVWSPAVGPSSGLTAPIVGAAT